jgi:predicted nicotinamide N-methyase
MGLALPSSYLPPIRNIGHTPQDALERHLLYLRKLYNPPVRGARWISQNRVFGPPVRRPPTSFSRPAHDDVEDVEVDDFERSYAVRWLTKLISLYSEKDLDVEMDLNNSTSSHVDETLLQDAAALLALCSGASGAGTFTRHFTFASSASSTPTSSSSSSELSTFKNMGDPITVNLTDVPLVNAEYESVGAQTWGGACVLAEMIAERPDEFGLSSWRRRSSSGSSSGLHDAVWEEEEEEQREGLRVLELGAGTGLVGLTVGKVLQAQAQADARAQVDVQHKTVHTAGLSRNGASATVVASDFYPIVLKNLERNIVANFGPKSPPVSVRARPLDWSVYPAQHDAGSADPAFSPAFDVIFGADIVYELEHAQWIRACVARLLRRPNPNFPYTGSAKPVSLLGTLDGLDNSELPNRHGAKMTANGSDDNRFHLIIPLRKTHTTESDTVEQVFPFAVSSSSSPNTGAVSNEGDKSTELVIVSKDVILCEAERGEEVEYVYYTIGWR